MKKILVPTDFSDNAYNALKYAAHLSDKTDAELILFNAFHMPASNTNVMIDISDVLKEGAEEQLKTVVKRIKKKFPDLKLHTACNYGLPDLLISKVAKEESADLIVMGTKGASGITTALFGSVTVHAIKNTNTPLLVVPENAEYRELDEIVLAVDYMNEEKQVKLQIIHDLVSIYGSHVDVVNVLTDLSEAPLVDTADEMAFGQRFGKLAASFNYVQNTSVEEGINEFMESHNADLLVMTAHSYSWLKKIFHRSMTKQMVLHAKTPLLIIQE